MAEPASAGDESRPVVAITRSVEDNRGLVGRLESLGFSVLAIPLIEVTAPADDGRALRAVLADLPTYDWVVLTSVNGVRAVAEARGGTPWPDAVAVAAVGPTTAAAARSAGMPVRLIPDVATASALVDHFPESDDDDRGRALAPLAELAGDTVVAGLRAKGWRVDRVEAYRTNAAPSVAEPSAARVDADVATFFSPSAVDRWVERFGPELPAVVCIGPSTAARAREAGFRRVVVADPHTEDGVIQALDGLVEAGGGSRASVVAPTRRDQGPAASR